MNEDVWTCEVTPYDMTDYGGSVSSVLTIQEDLNCYSIEFDGTSEARVSDISNIPIGNESRSVSAWFYSYPNSHSSNIVSWGQGLTNQGTNERFSVFMYGSNYDSSQPVMRVVGQDNDHFTYPVQWNEWTHVTVTYNSPNLLLYINGQLVDQTTTSFNTSSAYDLMIGTNTDNRDDEYFYGMIDDIVYHTRSEYEGMPREVRKASGGGGVQSPHFLGSGGGGVY